VILDPSTFAAQNLLPLLQFAVEHMPVDLTVLYTPKPPEMADYNDRTVPLTRIYKIAGPSGSVVVDVPDRGVVTAGVRTAMNTEWSRVGGEVDADNLSCVRGEDGGCKEAEVVYGIRKLVVNGQMFDEVDEDEDIRMTAYGGRQPAASAGVQVREAVWREKKKAMRKGNNYKTLTLSCLNHNSSQLVAMRDGVIVDDTVVMRNVGYFQLKVNSGGNYTIRLKPGSWGEGVYEEVEEVVEIKEWGGGWVKVKGRRKKGKENEVRGEEIVEEAVEVVEKEEGGSGGDGEDTEESKGGIWSALKKFVRPKGSTTPSATPLSQTSPPTTSDDSTVHVFSLATGHLYERFLKIMVLSVTSNTKRKVKFWLLENYLSPQFKKDVSKLVAGIGAEVEFVSYTWPSWLRGQTDLQRTIWGFKILFLDVLFPQDLEKIIFVDADQVMRTDIGELWDEDLEGKVWAYTPFCETNEETLGFQFWREGYWKELLGDSPYHISALYVIDLIKVRNGQLEAAIDSQH
jgi:hypothetical protein